MNRPTVGQVRRYKWLKNDGGTTEGIAIMRNRRLIAHLTPDEAIHVANQIIDTLEGEKP